MADLDLSRDLWRNLDSLEGDGAGGGDDGSCVFLPDMTVDAAKHFETVTSHVTPLIDVSSLQIYPTPIRVLRSTSTPKRPRAYGDRIRRPGFDIAG